MDDIARRVPYSLEAEQAVLGAVLIDTSVFPVLATTLRDDDFYLPEHREIYGIMRDMFSRGGRIDLVTLLNTLRENGTCEKAGGDNYLKLLGESCPSTANISDYAAIVKDKSTLRKLIEACSDISDEAFGEHHASEVVAFAEDSIYRISQDKLSGDFRKIDEVSAQVLQHLQDLATSGKEAGGVMTGYSDLDRVVIGMEPGDFIVIGARPGMGKTSFALNIAANVAKQTGDTVCIFSLEMGADQLVSRMLSSESLIDSSTMRTGRLSPAEWEKIADAVDRLSGSSIYIDDTAGISISQIRAKIRRLSSKVKKIGLIVIDYLQLLQVDPKPGRRFDNRTTEVGEMSRNLKLLAKDFGVPVICCAQLSRNPESRKSSEGGTTPRLSDLRESGSIEQDADVVMLLHSKDYYDLSKEERSAPTVFEVIVAKNRHGEQKNVKMAWIPRFTKFRTLVPEDDEMLKQAEAAERQRSRDEE